jgi:D-alanyl-D-alanine carboxypeptidase
VVFASRNAAAIAAVAALAAAACSSSNDKAATTTTAGKQPAYAAQLQTQIPEVMKQNAIPGVIVLVQSPEGNYTGTFGTAEIDKTVPMSTNDYIRIASNTKMYTSAVILQLVQEGKLSLDDPISKFRPDVPNGDNIKISELSEMRSGLFSYTLDPGFNETQDKDPQKAWTAEEVLAIAFKHPPNFAPGTQFEYSNTNIELLGVVIEKVTGLSLAEAYQKRIFDPLKLTHTLLPRNTDSSIPDPHPQGYMFGTNATTIESYALPPDQVPAALDGTLKPTNHTNDNPSYALAAGGLISKVDEMATFMDGLIGGRLLDPKTQKLQQDSVQPFNPAQPDGPAYGLGIIRFAPTLFGHDGQIPGYSSLMARDATKNTTIIIATNLSASPVNGANSATGVIGKVVRQAVLPS